MFKVLISDQCSLSLRHRNYSQVVKHSWYLYSGDLRSGTGLKIQYGIQTKNFLAECYAAHERSLRPTVDAHERVDRYHDHDQLFFDINCNCRSATAIMIIACSTVIITTTGGALYWALQLAAACMECVDIVRSRSFTNLCDAEWYRAEFEPSCDERRLAQQKLLV